MSQTNSDLELLLSLRKSSANLSFSSEGDYSYELFLWEIEKEGNFTIDRFLNGIDRKSNLVEVIEEVPDKQDLKRAFDRDNEPYFEVDGIEYEIIQTSRLDFQDDYLIECELYSRYPLFDGFFGYIYSDGGRLDEQGFRQYKYFADLVTDNTNFKNYRYKSISQSPSPPVNHL